ncbi:hypothetical protein TrVFT333_010626 [Trichoderma virens FT-333]|nr:hypothetical protein TrVFT333_010626 [Trichoderma virens FT-333]
MKCVFGSPADTICISCNRRGAKCVDQQFPEQISTPLDRSLQMGDRVVRVEALVEQLLEKVTHQSGPCCRCTTTQENTESSRGILSPVFANPIPAEPPSSYEPLEHDENCQYEILDYNGRSKALHLMTNMSHSIEMEKHQALSRILRESLPTLKDIEIIAQVRGDLSALFYQMLTVPYNDLDQNDPRSLEGLFEQPGSNAHPVLIGLYMLRIATFLQHLHPDLHGNLKGLSESPRRMMNRLFNTAVSLVTTNESLIGSIEGLECVMMESLWYTNSGNLRQGLIAIRRAMTTAQLMGCHRSRSSAQCRLLGSKRKIHPRFIWFRIVFAERHLCLMLGLPQSTVDQSMASKEMLENDTPMGRLERIHCVIASRILQRNQSDPSPHDFALTQELDGELKKAAEVLPKKWWLHSNLASTLDHPETLFWDMRRLFHQLFHYHLLNQLHLPYMLRSSLDEHENQYSRVTCVNASREVLSRFIMFRSSDRIAFWCRTMDFLSLMAALTLLIAHIDGHCQGSIFRNAQQQQTARPENLLTHQRPGDLAMIEQVQESIEEVSQQNGDVLGARSAELLRRLLFIEAEAASSHAKSVDGVSAQVPAATYDPINEERRGTISLYIPYFGTVKIARGGTISKAMITEPPHTTNTANESCIQGLEAHRAENTVGTSKTCSSVPVDVGCSCKEPLTETDIRTKELPAVGAAVRETNNTTQEYNIPDSFLQQEEDLLFSTGIDDWDYPNVNMAFFDSLMREAGDDGGEMPI